MNISDIKVKETLNKQDLNFYKEFLLHHINSKLLYHCNRLTVVSVDSKQFIKEKEAIVEDIRIYSIVHKETRNMFEELDKIFFSDKENGK